ncbi:MAG TPA: hypothetical protein DCS75_05980 [Gemmatimonadetes bacterium]|nr:hypothetical protein [Gemmatimonadota bacterium]HBV06760.1 hypothetical protein [Gemmatimonadota bacterium]HCO13165.1 hypothetical protein [Gemmatimonadota bacterium]|tara:strand:+ start:4608 stop:5030 length:423 start_codon:yes stop_codon:yes gene_type:complete
MKKMTFAFATVAAILALTSCVDNSDETLGITEANPPLWLDIRLAGSQSQPQALLFEIVGGATDSIVSDQHRVFAETYAQNRTKALLFGDLNNEVLARVWMSNPSAWDEYRIVLEQVALDEDFEQPSAMSYSLQLEAPSPR